MTLWFCNDKTLCSIFNTLNFAICWFTWLSCWGIIYTKYYFHMSLVTNTFYFTNTNTNSKVFLLIKLTEEVLCYKKKYIFFTIICPLISTHISIKVIAYTIVGLALDFVHSRASFAVIEQFYTVNLSWKQPVRMLPFWVNLVQIMT